MRTGLWILAIFAAAWASAALLATGHPPAWTLPPIAVSSALMTWVLREPATAAPIGPHVRRLVARWSMAEVAGFLVVFYALQKLHRFDAMFPAGAVIVGLHFLPLARGIPIRLYYPTGIALVLLGLAGLLLPPDVRPLAIGIGAAVILWMTAVGRVLELRRTPAR